MRRRHEHLWEPVSAHYHPPRPGPLDGEGPEDMLLAMLYGLTTVTQHCTRCGRVESYTIPGQALPADPRHAEDAGLDTDTTSN